MKTRIQLIPLLCKPLVIFLVLFLPFFLTSCTSEKNAFQEKYFSQVRPFRGNAEAHYQLACHYQDRNRHREALEEFRKVIAINPGDVRAYNGIGISCDALKDFPRAYLAYEKALKLNPQAGYVYNNLGYSYVLQKRYNEAVLAFRKAAEQTGNEAMRGKIGNNLNMALALSEKPQMAAAIQQDAPASTRIAAVSVNSFDLDGHIRNHMIQRNPLADQPASRASASATIPSNSVNKADIAIEVANGNGVRHMARNVGEYLKKQGYNVVRLTNADSYNYSKGNVSYRPDGRQTAQEIAAIIPGEVDMKKLNDGNRKDVRVRVLVGKDLIPYKKVFTEDRG
ncbi:LytR C-terminal domain-containing protein [Syntrophus aciditrophicus]|uniref:Tetratricopeptide repeat family protein n=1 Tax=Syntrophus aciditrophicus (strain SB) TaxID=56780 RepID=Q2LSV1_SYNAS|nr:LytR C-terminal domain-containing protein [Syntrophus aciditrophicus]ABC77165.1 tetratricopeptide repeat family protein [Syntrophus aciditrophicus SB]OPY16730.1 MAG: lipoprotein NlpI [Syntrophus sp. PtaB.Bin075]